MLQNRILDQHRLVKKGIRMPIYTDSRMDPFYIVIEELCGYKSNSVYGILSNDTELVVINSSDCADDINSSPRFEPRIIDLVSIPTTSFKFFSNSLCGLSRLCSFKEHSFIVEIDDSLPEGVILVPEIILISIFKLRAKSKICISSNSSKVFDMTLLGQYHFSVDGLNCKYDSNIHIGETVIPCDNGIIAFSNEIGTTKVCPIEISSLLPLNCFASFLHSSSKRMILFHGPSGCGKSKTVLDAMTQLNFRPDFHFQFQYLDLSVKSFTIDESLYVYDKSIIILDHADEYLNENENEDREKPSRKLFKLHYTIMNLLSRSSLCRICLIVRSIRDFSGFLKNAPLPFDFLFTSVPEKSEWGLAKPHGPWNDIFGQKHAKLQLERYILNPIRFNYIFQANNMKLHSGYITLMTLINILEYY